MSHPAGRERLLSAVEKVAKPGGPGWFRNDARDDRPFDPVDFLITREPIRGRLDTPAANAKLDGLRALHTGKIDAAIATLLHEAIEFGRKSGGGT